jgi:hypothetical protein
VVVAGFGAVTTVDVTPRHEHADEKLAVTSGPQWEDAQCATVLSSLFTSEVTLLRLLLVVVEVNVTVAVAVYVHARQHPRAGASDMQEKG